VHFADDFSRFTWPNPLKQKFEIVQGFTQFKKLTENQFNKKKIKVI